MLTFSSAIDENTRLAIEQRIAELESQQIKKPRTLCIRVRRWPHLSYRLQSMSLRTGSIIWIKQIHKKLTAYMALTTQTKPAAQCQDVSRTGELASTGITNHTQLVDLLTKLVQSVAQHGHHQLPAVVTGHILFTKSTLPDWASKASLALTQVCADHKAGLLSTMLGSTLSALLKSCSDSPSLTREENVTAENFPAFQALQRQTKPSSNVIISQDPNSMDAEESPVALLQAQLPNIVKALQRQIKTRQGCFSLLMELILVLHGALANHMVQLIPGIQFRLGSNQNNSNMKIDTFSFIQCLLAGHHHTVFHTQVATLVPAIISSVSDSFYKMSSDNLRQELASCLPIFLERLKNEITRLTAVKALISIASSPLHIDLRCILTDSMMVLSSFLRNQLLLDTMVKNYSPSLALDTLSPVLAELPPLVSETDLHIAQLTLNLLTSISVNHRQAIPTTQTTVLPEVLKLAESPPFTAMLDFFKSVVSAGVPGLAHSDLLALLVNPVLGGKEGTIHKQGRANIAECVASLVSHRETVGVVKQFMRNLPISCMGQIVAHLGDSVQQELASSFPIFLERLNNEISRLTAVNPPHIDLRCILSDGMPVLPAFLRKNQRALKLSTLLLLDTMVTNYSTSLALDTLSSVLTVMPPLVSKIYLHITQLTLNLLTSISVNHRQAISTIQTTVLSEVLKVAESPLLQGAALTALVNSVLAGVPGLAHSDLLGEKAETIHKQGRANISKCVASLVSHSEREAVGVVKQFMENLRSNQQDYSLTFRLLAVVGETGPGADLSQLGELKPAIITAFSILSAITFEMLAAFDIFDVRLLALLLRGGVERNPGPGSDEWLPKSKRKRPQPLPVPRRRSPSNSGGRSDHTPRRQYGGRGGSRGRSLNEDEEFVCICGNRYK